MKIAYSSHFLRSAKKLPHRIQEKLARVLEIFKQNPFDTRLHTKNLAGHLAGFFSFRVTRDWRVVFEFIDKETIQLIEAANRKDIYRR